MIILNEVNIMRQIPLVKPCLPKLEEIEKELRALLDSGRLTNFGPFSQKLEKRICELLGVRYALCISNATTGLILLLNTLPKGSEVIVPSFTFLPTVQAIIWNSLKPVFVDIDVNTYNILPSEVYSKISDRTSAILAVHVFGNPCAVEELEDIASQKGLRLFFDSAHAFGAKHCNKYIGGFGAAEVFSFSATKLLPCGEGGIVTTNNEFIYKAIKNRRNYGFLENSCDCANMGLNGKITEFSAMLGIKEIEFIDFEVKRRNQIAQRYREALCKVPGIEFQKISPEDISSYKDFAITINFDLLGVDREHLMEDLSAKGIETRAYFSPSVHQMKYFRKNKSIDKRNLDNTELLEKRILSLPIYSDLTDDELRYVIFSLKNLINSYENTRGGFVQQAAALDRYSAALHSGQ